MTLKDLENEYRNRFDISLEPVSERLKKHIESLLKASKRVERVTARPKSVKSFMGKANTKENGNFKYSDPINQVQDQIGARVIVFYLRDVEAIAEDIKKYFRAIEEKDIVPESDSEFGYFGKHYIFFLPEDVLDDECRKTCPRFFELQIKTLFQHAWSEANHDLGYKASSSLTSNHRRKIAFSSAQAWGADQIFNDLHREINSTK